MKEINYKENGQIGIRDDGKFDAFIKYPDEKYWCLAGQGYGFETLEAAQQAIDNSNFWYAERQKNYKFIEYKGLMEAFKIGNVGDTILFDGAGKIGWISPNRINMIVVYDNSMTLYDNIGQPCESLIGSINPDEFVQQLRVWSSMDKTIAQIDKENQ